MLMELVLEVATRSADPHHRLAELLDRLLSSRTQAGPTRDTSFMIPFRAHAEAFFVMAPQND